MTALIQPLSSQVNIVDEQGRPTPQFMQILQKLSLGAGLSKDAAGNITFAAQAAKTILANKTAGSANPTACTIDDILDFIAGTAAQGDILYRGSTGYKRLPAGTSGQFLKTNGAGADPAWGAAGGGGGSTMGFMPLFSAASPGVTNYLGAGIYATDNFTANKVGFYVTNATATTKYQAFLYALSTAGLPTGSLLASSNQITGVTAGYNEAPFTAGYAMVKNTWYFIGVSVITAGLSGLWCNGNNRAGFVANGGSSVPAATAPSAWSMSGNYGFWAVT